ncbi:hypothetical protein MKW92_048488 [Papaver armeniacum]|nr:hypothetical protein MKW92_048488 [Papaver armeniacum]
MADALVSFLIDELCSTFKQEIEQKVRLVTGVGKEVKKLESAFITLQAVLKDAEERETDESSVKNWLTRLKNAAYEMEDVLDEWSTEMRKKQLKFGEEDDEGEKPNKNQVTTCLTSFRRIFSFFREVSVRNDIALKIKEIQETIETIKDERKQFKFTTSDQRAQDGSYTHEGESSSIIVDRQSIVGRSSDLENIVNKLLGVESSTNYMENKTTDHRIISITGMGGLGKTTLAQLVFDHDKVKTHFKLLMWVCVSDPFDRIKVAKAIIREATPDDDGIKTDFTWNNLFDKLCKSVEGKKCLLVLDDLCTSDPNNLKELIHLLGLLEQGSRFLVTTRNESVVLALNSWKYMLQGLNDDHSISLLFGKAFHGKEEITEESKLLENIGALISNKCEGLPLGLSLLGTLLNRNYNENYWRRVLENKIWELKGFDGNRNLLRPLCLLSYNGLESQLRTCFQFCATFEKSDKIRKHSLVRLWMALNLLNSSNKDPVLTGEEYFDELAERSFFQNISIDGAGRVCCKMHDLVHEFAQFLTKDHCYASHNNEDKFGSSIHHLTLIYDEHDVGPNSFHNSIRKIHNVRSIQCKRKSSHEFTVGDLSSDLFGHLRFLRVLKLKGMGITRVPNEIDNLIFLRYLDLSWNWNLSELPDSLCTLINLQTLKLKGCISIIKLPKEMGRMINLRNVDLREAGLEYLPKGIKNWKSLQTLSNFVVSAATEGCKIEELKHLSLLKDCLQIVGLGRLKSAEQAVEAKLQTKSQLTELLIDFNFKKLTPPQPTSVAFEVLGVLQPHSNLKKLTVNNYLGLDFPSWMGDTTALTNLRCLKLHGCSECRKLPALGLLPSLEELEVKELANLGSIGVEIYGGTGSQCVTEVAFPKLIRLEISKLEKLGVWEFGNREVGEMMPRVSRIIITDCVNLIVGPALHQLPSLHYLEIKHAHQLTSISPVSSRGFTLFPKLAELVICSMNKLEGICLGGTREEEKGDINCEIAMMPSLRSLSIEDCPELKSFRSPPSIEKNQLSCLIHLSLHKCTKLISFPSHLPSLSSFSIYQCPSLIFEDRHPQIPISPNLTKLSLSVQQFALVNLEYISQLKELQCLKIAGDLSESYQFIPVYVQNLKKLEELRILDGSLAAVEGRGDWRILSHIPVMKCNASDIDLLTFPASSSSNQVSLLRPG